MLQPGTLKKLLIAIGVLYLIFPRDLLPDYFGRGLGLLDDATVAALLVAFYRRQLRAHAERQASGQGAGSSQRSSSAPPRAAPAEPAFDPRAVLGVAASASDAEIRAAYRERMQEYHPDKVEHLGEELRELAHRKALEIQRAYEALRPPP